MTVDNDHTYFIAGNYKVQGVWVHNNCNPAWINDILKSQKIAPDLVNKGVHFNVGKVELKALPNNNGGITFKPVFSSYRDKDVSKAISEANKALDNPAFRDYLIKHADKGMKMTQQTGNAKYLEFKMLKIAAERLN